METTLLPPNQYLPPSYLSSLVLALYPRVSQKKPSRPFTLQTFKYLKNSIMLLSFQIFSPGKLHKSLALSGGWQVKDGVGHGCQTLRHPGQVRFRL